MKLNNIKLIEEYSCAASYTARNLIINNYNNDDPTHLSIFFLHDKQTKSTIITTKHTLSSSSTVTLILQ